MRKVLFTLLSVIVSAMCFAGETVWVYDSNGTRTPYELAKVDSLSFAEPGYLYLNPDVKNLSSDGGRFSVYIDSKKPWTATVSDPTTIILSKNSGIGSDSISVFAFANAECHPYSATVTIKLDDGTTAVLPVNVSSGNEFISLYLVDDKGWWTPVDTINVPRSGGEFEVYVSSNTDWYLYHDSHIHTSQSSGNNDGTIKISVDPNTGRNELTTSLDFHTIGNNRSVYIKQEGTNISVVPTMQGFYSVGGIGRLGIKSNSNWSVSSDQEWLKLEQIDGTLNDSIYIFVDECDDDSVATATITVTTDDGKSAQCRVTVGRPEKCKASDYKQVTIGNQTWMAENYRCPEYDTESEAYNASWLTDNTLPSVARGDSPYYIDATDKVKWSSEEYAGNLTSEQIAKLGYLYNWAAAVGVDDGSYYGKEPFTGNRQGICPNGWHIPTQAEWQTLYDYIYNAQELLFNAVGKYLKTTSGWYQNGNGTDSYGFAALPSGCTDWSGSFSVGEETSFWTATPSEFGRYVGNAYDSQLYYGDGHLDIERYGLKHSGASVRCLKD